MYILKLHRNISFKKQFLRVLELICKYQIVENIYVIIKVCSISESQVYSRVQVDKIKIKKLLQQILRINTYLVIFINF